MQAMDIGEIRHRNFAALIEGLERSGIKRRGDQGARLGGFLSASYVSQLLGGKYIGDEVARKISEAMGHDRGWMDRPQWNAAITVEAVAPSATPSGYVRFDLFEGAAGMGAGVANSDYPEVIRTVDVAEWEIRKKLGFLPAPGRMRLITGRGPSMRPKIEDGDVVMVDTTVTYFDGDDYYLISVDGETQIKMLQKRTDGLYVVSSNPDFREWRIGADDLIVCGKALIGLGLRRL